MNSFLPENVLYFRQTHTGDKTNVFGDAKPRSKSSEKIIINKFTYKMTTYYKHTLLLNEGLLFHSIFARGRANFGHAQFPPRGENWAWPKLARSRKKWNEF